MHITTGTMTTVLDTLERNGYIRRLADSGDRRRVLVDITPAAQTVLDQMLPEVQQLAKAIMGVLDDDALHRLLDTLATSPKRSRIHRRTSNRPNPAAPPATSAASNAPTPAVPPQRASHQSLLLSASPLFTKCRSCDCKKRCKTFPRCGAAGLDTRRWIPPTKGTS
jgi:hypothetical protein